MNNKLNGLCLDSRLSLSLSLRRKAKPWQQTAVMFGTN